MSATHKTDLLIAGGGLAGGLVALALARTRPGLCVTIVEGAPRLGGNHIWSFFDSDIAPEHRWLIEAVPCRHWDGHDVRFPGYDRTLQGGYNAIESERFDQAVRAALPVETIVAGRISGLGTQAAVLDDGTRIEAEGVIDARGPRDLAGVDLGWQKFLGQLLQLETPHGLTRPVIMDATVDQSDGYHFVYLLPFGPTELFVEDTSYSTTQELDRDRLRRQISDYAAGHGWRIATVAREEMAALPIAMGGDFGALWPACDRVPRVGMAAGLFQPMTGYSLPDAVRTAALIAQLPDLSSRTLAHALRNHARGTWRKRGFFRLLARLLFRAADPPERYRLLERFYSLNERLIGRFYAGQPTLADRFRILAGRPPVALHRALAALRERA